MIVKVTVDGQPLEDYVEEQLGTEIEAVRVHILTKIGKSTMSHTHSKPTQNSGLASGRTRGNPGVKRATVLTPQQVDEVNRQRGLGKYASRPDGFDDCVNAPDRKLLDLLTASSPQPAVYNHSVVSPDGRRRRNKRSSR